MWDVENVGCLERAMTRMWDVYDVGYLGCAICNLWDVLMRDMGFRMFAAL